MYMPAVYGEIFYDRKEDCSTNERVDKCPTARTESKKKRYLETNKVVGHVYNAGRKIASIKSMSARDCGGRS